MPCEELKPENEIFLRWGPDYQQWHDRHWSPESYAAITVNTGSTLQRFLNEPERWAIAPMSIISEIVEITQRAINTKDNIFIG